MQQVSGQFGKGQFHALLRLAEPRLGGEEIHRQTRSPRIAGRDQGLKQGAEHRIQRQPGLEPLDQLPFQRLGMDMGQQARHVDQGRCQRIHPGGRGFGLARAGGLVEQLAREVRRDAAHPGDDLVTEDGVIVIGQ